jgi:hypothetical protein
MAGSSDDLTVWLLIICPGIVDLRQLGGDQAQSGAQKIVVPLAFRRDSFGGPAIKAFAGLHSQLALRDSSGQGRRWLGVACQVRVHRGRSSAVYVKPGVIPLKDRPGGQESEAEAEADRRIDVLRRGHAGIDQRERLAGQRMLQAIGEEARQVLAHQHRHHAATPHEAAQSLAAGRIRLDAEHDFDQRHEMRGHEVVQTQHSPRTRQFTGDGRDREA